MLFKLLGGHPLLKLTTVKADPALDRYAET